MATTYRTHGGNVFNINGAQLDGLGVVEGTLMIESNPNDPLVPDIPVARFLRLHRESDGLPVKETYSDAYTGAFKFTNVHMGFRYTVIAYDNVGHSYRAVVADNLIPVLP